MGLAPLLKEIDLSEPQLVLREAFFEATGYGSSDLLSLNYDTRIFLTRNGGKYRVNPTGIEHLAGPPAGVEDRWEF